MSYDGDFDVNIQNDAQVFDMTLSHQDDKSKDHRSEGKATDSSRDNRTTGRNRTQAIEPSRDDHNTQPTVAQEPDYYRVLSCSIHDSAKEITRKGMNKEKEVFDRGMRRMSKEETEDLNAEAERVSEAFRVLNDKNRRRAYYKKRDSLHGNQGSR